MNVAIHDCQNLNEDAGLSDAEDGGEDEMPGAGEWITSENMDQYLDDEGNFIDGGRLGSGAGHIRTLDEVDEGVNGGTTAEDEHDEGETKWRRTD